MGHVLPASTVDWRGKVAAVVFLRGCSFRCPYCQNHALLEPGKPRSPAIIEKALRRDRKFLDGVVLSGGEPLVQPEGAAHLCRYAGGLGLARGVQTNGNHPDALAALLEGGLLDAVFLDVKAPLHQECYRRVCGVDDENVVARVRESLRLGLRARQEGGLGYLEVRTTVFPRISDVPEEVEAIARAVRGVDRYVLQQGRPEHALTASIQNGGVTTRDTLLSLAAMARRHLPAVGVRSRKGGEEDV